MIYLWIALGGAAGALSRYVVDDVVTRATGTSFPLGTLVINISGSFAVGVLFALVTERAVLPADIRAPVMIGFLGAYTTFSTFGSETYELTELGHWGLAVGNVALSAAAGVAAVALGQALGRL